MYTFFANTKENVKIGIEVRKIYEFYVDVFVIRNILLQMTVFLWMMCLLEKRPALHRLLAASVIESVLQLLCVRFSVKKMLLVMFIAQCIIFPKVLCPGMKQERLYQALLYYVALVSVHSSMMKLALQINREHFFFLEAGAALLIMFLLVLMKKCKEEKNGIYHTTIFAFGEQVKVDALLDTGNELKEKNSGKMVCIVEKECMETILKHVSWEDYHFITFHSVGQEQGILATIEADRIAITEENGTKNIYGVMIGIYTGKLSSTGKFQMILHKDCLKGRMKNGNNVEHLFAKTYESRGA